MDVSYDYNFLSFAIWNSQVNFIIPLCEKLDAKFTWSFHVFKFCFLLPHGTRQNNHAPVCEAILMARFITMSVYVVDQCKLMIRVKNYNISQLSRLNAFFRLVIG
ncbi:hypothetical protein [Carboxylicivirga sp. M1479]|uniref:hypothetical protein n=1 Tax=Carboxylicivirga sp. M1479 TaxID=2594476 RepID=UPI0011782FE9|nr:hypothetical protein [Carboxylicivirga sp. M1479]TRX64332.1 hypothetical protein FNN09_17895 [Carboxylicivirga sp. M1479]